jgi:CDP-diacylglycerol---serine O-phosphatidyltransferase
MEAARRHVKDFFTLINLLSGVVAVHWVLNDKPRQAGFAVIFGYLAGDLLDGQVARALGTFDRFGAELDSIVDHFVHVLVPGLILWWVFEDSGHEVQGTIAFGALIAGATIRHARLAAVKFDFPSAWNGLPRTISGFTAMALALSKTVNDNIVANHTFVMVAVVLISAMNVLPIPYMTHRGQRAMQRWAFLLVLGFIVTPLIAFVVARQYVFDVFGFWMLGYAALGWFPLHPEERKAFYVEHARWTEALTSR